MPVRLFLGEASEDLAVLKERRERAGRLSRRLRLDAGVYRFRLWRLKRRWDFARQEARRMKKGRKRG